MLTVRDAAKRAGVSESLVYAWCRDGVLPHARLGRPGRRGTIRIDAGEFEAFLRTMRVDDAPADDGPLKWIK